MKLKLFAGALALALFVHLPLAVHHARAAKFDGSALERITAIDIVRIKTALKLTAAQQPYWRPVEATLIDISRHQDARAESDGLLRRVIRRAVTIALNGAAVARLATAARPLIASLDDEHKQIAMQIAQEMGLGPVIARLD